jgi:hypothetical protein
MSGCWIVVVPSCARTSPQLSSQWLSAMCQCERCDVSSSYEAEAEDHLDFCERSSEVEVGRRVVHRVAADDDERRHAARRACRSRAR